MTATELRGKKDIAAKFLALMSSYVGTEPRSLTVLGFDVQAFYVSRDSAEKAARMFRGAKYDRVVVFESLQESRDPEKHKLLRTKYVKGFVVGARIPATL